MTSGGFAANTDQNTVDNFAGDPGQKSEVNPSSF